ncbi:hypothetical protein A2U01_0114953, partial [Trifolium medium]|nr:hypothetical protein [Trifolium medium]
VVIVVVYE